MDLKKFLSEKKLLIFDCDGVIFDSDQANAAYFKQCLTQAGYEDIPKTIGDKITYMSIEQIIREFIQDEKEVKRLIDISQSIEYDPYLSMLKPNGDIDAIFTFLKNNYHLAVASNRGKSLLKVFHYFNLFKYFNFKISALEAKSKPDPEMLYRCMDYFGIEKKMTVFIGDSISDCNAAKNACVDFLWVGNNTQSQNIDSINDLLQKTSCK